MKKNSNEHILAADDISSLLWKLSVPAMVGMFVMALYNIVDTIFVGRFVGTNAIAALTVCFPIQMIIMGMGIMNGIGSAALISISLGEKNTSKANTIFQNSLLQVIFMGLGFTFLTQIFMEDIILLFGANESILPVANQYLSVITLGAVFQIGAMTGNNIIRSEGQAKIAMLSMAGGATLNIILDAILIIGFKMGVRGAAIATVTAQISQVVFQNFYFRSNKSTLKYKICLKTFDLKITYDTFKIGISAFLRNIAGSVMMVILNNVLKKYGGAIAIAAIGVIFRVIQFSFMPIIGISQGMQPIAGYNFGAKRMEKVLAVLKMAIFRASLISLASYLIIMGFPKLIISIFSNDSQLLDLAGNAVRMVFAAGFVIGFQVVGSTFFMAVNKALPALILSISRQILILIPLLFILPNIWGLNGAWIAHPISDVIAAFITAAFLIHELKNIRRKEKISKPLLKST